MTGHRYRAFGLKIESDRAISSLAPSESTFAGPADVEIPGGEIRAPDRWRDLDGAEIAFNGDGYFLTFEKCGLFQVIGGRRIVVQPDPLATARQVDLYLLGSVFGALMHQRGILPFHCNAVEVEGFAFLFCGDSGAGKSTLAAHFVERGFRLLSDDLCALHFDDEGRLVAAGGVARLKLWQDTLEHFGRSSAGLPLVPLYDEKFELPLGKGSSMDPLPVAALYHLRETDGARSPGIYPLHGLDAANSVTANIYRRRHADVIGAAPSYLAAAARIVRQIPIFAMNRNWGLAHFEREALAAEEHMRQLVVKMVSTGL